MATGRVTAAIVLVEAATQSASDVMDHLDTTASGLTDAQADARRAAIGPNTVRTHRLRAAAILLAQLRSPLLLLLAVTALVSAFLGQQADAIIIGIILAASVGLGFVNEYRAGRAAVALQAQLRHRVTVVRDGRPRECDVTALVPGDIVHLQAGEVVPADIRLVHADDLECDEAVITGESLPVPKDVAPVAQGSALADLSCCALMGTLVRAGVGTGVVVATGPRAEFGRVAASLGERAPETEFQRGLRSFSMLLVIVAAILTVVIFAINIALHRPILEAVLFSLAIAVGISPQLLPAVVSTSLAAGARSLARDKVLVKRMVCIEDLGDIEVLFTDKTGTLTEGRVAFMRALGTDGSDDDTPVPLALACTDVTLADGIPVSGNALDRALWESPASGVHADEVGAWMRLADSPFDHVTRTASVAIARPDGTRELIVKGAPESIIARCASVDPRLAERIAAEFAAGNRVIAVARAPLGQRDDAAGVASDASWPLRLAGALVFLDPPRQDAAAAIARLADLHVTVKVVTGDNAVVAEHVCDALGLTHGGTLSGADLDAMDDERLAALIPVTRVFARVSPEQKARLLNVARASGTSVAFLGDGVNDAVALHAADVGISVDSATDIARDAADVILLEKDLGVLATGVVGGRRVFANTIKYVLMGTSSNFGNMVSAAGASAILPFLPMLPSQILLNNLLYDSSQLAIPTDHVDEDQLQRPSHWNIGMIRRFMLYFGPLSSAFDFLTFAVLIWGLHAGESEFHTGWFVESLATQTLVIFVIRTRRVPFLRSRPSLALTLAALSVVLVGALLPISPVSTLLGFTPLPWTFYGVLALMVVAYLVLVDTAKGWFFRHLAAPAPRPRTLHERGLHRRAARFTATQAHSGTGVA